MSYFRLVSYMCVAAVLASCGGGDPAAVTEDAPSVAPSPPSVTPGAGSIGGGGTPQPVSPSQGSVTTITIPETLQTVTTFADGQQIVRLYSIETGEIFVGLADGAELLSELENGTLTNFQNIETAINGNHFQVLRSATGAQGETISLAIDGLNLNSAGSEYVARVFMTDQAGGHAYVVAGTPVEDLPSGEVTYNGTAEIIAINTTAETQAREVGEFTFAINFGSSAPVGRITGASETYQFVGASVALNKTTTSLSSSSIEIGPILGTTLPATLAGNIMGAGGTGVGGVVSSEATNGSSYLASFYGTSQ